MNPPLMLTVGALGLVGCLILLYVGIQMLREERAAKDRQEAAAPVEGTGPADGPAETTPDAAPTPAKPAPAKPAFGRPKGSAHEVLRVLRDNLTGRLIIEIAGRRYANLDELTDPALNEGLLTTLADLRAFTNGAAAAPEAEAPPAARALPTPTPAVPAVPPAAPKPLPPPTMNPFKQMQVLRELAKNPPPEPKTIAEQIDEVLQGRLAGTPLAERGLHIRPGPRGEALFDLDGESYPAVDDVPDLAVREALKGAIAAWEQAR
ncbi:MAG: hypothetical protein IT317_18585 [Anaerolineales bacterium]|nr:hypothetical protein [Anaerolineales bacterium]